MYIDEGYLFAPWPYFLQPHDIRILGTTSAPLKNMLILLNKLLINAMAKAVCVKIKRP
jgi:hypothetical protein